MSGRSEHTVNVAQVITVSTFAGLAIERQIRRSWTRWTIVRRDLTGPDMWTVGWVCSPPFWTRRSAERFLTKRARIIESHSAHHRFSVERVGFNAPKAGR